MKNNLAEAPASSKYWLLGVALFIAALVMARAHYADRGMAAFSVLGSPFVIAERLPNFLAVASNSGYDGQYFMRIALNPFDLQTTDFGIRLDLPAYRYQRIGYPFAAFALALGQERWVPASLILVNVLSIIGMTWVLMELLSSLGVPSWYAIIPACLGGTLMALARDLAEPLAAFFVLATLLGALRKKPTWIAITATCAVLTRETSALSILGIGVAHFFIERKKPISLAPFLFAALSFLLWQFYIQQKIGVFPLEESPNNFTWPIWGLLDQWLHYPYREKPIDAVVKILPAIFVLMLGVFAWRSAITSVGPRPLVSYLRTCWWIWTAFAFWFSTAIWCDDWSFMRVLLEWMIFSILLILADRRALQKSLLFFSGIIFLETTLRLIVRI